MTAKQIREQAGIKRVDFAKYYNIPLRTMENWESGTTEAPAYVLDLLERAVREDFKKPNIFRVYSIAEHDEFEMFKTKSRRQAIEFARVEAQRTKQTVEIRLHVCDIDDEDCTCFDYDTIDF